MSPIAKTRLWCHPVNVSLAGLSANKPLKLSDQVPLALRLWVASGVIVRLCLTLDVGSDWFSEGEGWVWTRVPSHTLLANTGGCPSFFFCII
jgi:hypothetical protein